VPEYLNLHSFKTWEIEITHLEREWRSLPVVRDASVIPTSRHHSLLFCKGCKVKKYKKTSIGTRWVFCTESVTWFAIEIGKSFGCTREREAVR
jgi:hypothetical protein